MYPTMTSLTISIGQKFLHLEHSTAINEVIVRSSHSILKKLQQSITQN
jgi:hypothetical protein